MKKFLFLSFTILSVGLYADLSSAQLAEIEQKVSSMGIKELQDRRSFLINEEDSLMNELNVTQNPSTNKAMSERLAAVRAELSAIQKVLLALVGAGAIASVTDDGYDDNVPPVITVIGDNPATVELGDTYTDQGATAFDEFHGVTQVTSSGTVDTSTVGTYTITYSATDLDGNTATATRTVNVVDTTAPVITSSDTFVADENQTAIGTVTATDLQTVTFTVSGTELQITSDGVLTFVTAPDYETKSVYTATVTATDASSNSTTQDITVNVNDVGGIDDDPGTGTGTSTSTGTGTGTGTQ